MTVGVLGYPGLDAAIIVIEALYGPNPCEFLARTAN